MLSAIAILLIFVASFIFKAFNRLNNLKLCKLVKPYMLAVLVVSRHIISYFIHFVYCFGFVYVSAFVKLKVA